MKTFNRVLGVVLAIAMLMGVFSMMASALAPDSAIDLTLTVDKASYVAGEEVVVTIYEQVDAVVGDMTMGGQYAIAYPSTFIKPYSTTSNEPADHGISDTAAGYDASISTVSLNENNTTGLGDWIEAADVTNYGWDEIINYILGTDGTVVPMQSAPAAIASFKMRIDSSCPDGDYVIGFNTGSYMNYSGWSWDVAMGGVYGYDDDNGYGTTANYSMGTVTIHVGAAATMEVNPIANAQSGYGQIRFQGTDPAANHDFDIRIGSTITNVNEVYADEAAFAADIVDIGFIFSASAMSAADAATVAEGGSVSGITKKSLDDQYLQRITSGETYKFFCFVTDIAYADVNSTLYAYAYVQTSANGYFYYPAVISITYSDLYNAYVGDYNTYLASL